MNNFKWLNESKIIENNGKITILAAEKSDFFRNPQSDQAASGILKTFRWKAKP